MENGYRVTRSDCVCEFTEKKSRFISYLSCVSCEAAAREFVEKIRLKHSDATHNCVAYRLWNPRIERFSDDGEPAGTAGMPMLEVMKKEDVYDVCVVVTRYFGGILLGGGGLIRAYSRGVSDALAASGFALRRASVTLELVFGYSGYSAVEKYLESVTHNRFSCDFGEKVTLTLSVPESDEEQIISKLNDLLCGSLSARRISRGYDSFK